MSPLYVHVGMAKAFSSSLQTAFAAHPGIVFLGLDPAYPDRLWFRPPLGEMFDRTLRFGDDHGFEAAAPGVRDALAMARREGGPVVLSSENATLRFIPNDLPTDTKLKRLARLLPEDAKLVLVHRPPRALLISLYKEYVLFGDARPFDEFVRDALRYRAFNFFNDLLLGRLLSRLDDVFGLARVILRPADTSRLEALVAKIGGGEPVALEQRNPSMSDAEAAAMARDNAERATPVAPFEMFVELHRACNEDPRIPEDVRFALARRKKDMRAASTVAGEARGLPALPAALDEELEAVLRADRAVAEKFALSYANVAEGLAVAPAQ